MFLVLLTFICCYTAAIIYLTVSVLKNTGSEIATSKVNGISIVIPFRNEEKNIPDLLSSLGKQDYIGPFEIILVNDGSTDDSLGKIHDHKHLLPCEPIVLDSTFDPGLKLTSKQQALETGFRRASHQWIALTDADIRLSSSWLSSLSINATPDTALLFGHTSILTEKINPFHLFQAFQLEFLFAAAFAMHQAKIPGSCMGNNLLVSKSAYMECGGQKAIGYNIVEDMALLNLFLRQKKPVSANQPFTPTAFTPPEDKLCGFLNQTKRWALGGFSSSPVLALAGLLFFLQNILFLSVPFMPIHPALSVAVCANFLLTWLFIATAFRKTGSCCRAIYFPFYYSFLLLESAVLLFSMLLKPGIEWKNRKI